jgi:formate dehydrogenase major subunit/formate dehydrogenase alpha subunit
VAGLATSYGSGAMSQSIDDIAEQARAFLVIGSNTTEQHPVIGFRIRQAVKQRQAVLIVADPRRIPLTDFATLHLRHKPGTDIALINGLIQIILANGWEDKDFIQQRTENFEEFKKVLVHYTPEQAAQITGVPVAQLQQAAELMVKNKPMAVLWAMGITQHIKGVNNVMALANLQMVLGNIGIPGGGVNPLRGQNNVQGACDMGGLPNVYPGYQPVTDAEAQRKFEAAWGVPLSPRTGMTVTEMMPDILEGKIKALYILGEDPIMSDADTNHVRHCLKECPLVVLQELFPSETEPYADILLPGASFAEKTGTVTNTERRIQMVRQAIASPGEARKDWEIIADLCRRLLQKGERRVQEAPYSGWDYGDTGQIMAEIAALTPSYAGVTLERLERGETFQWPVKDSEHPGTPILHVGKFSRGQGRFAPVEYTPPAEQTDREFPYVLSTGRVLYHWHGGQMSRRSRGLLAIYPKPLIEINSADAKKIGVDGNRHIRITSRRGSIDAEAWITDRVPPGVVYGNFHFPESSVNTLTNAALDPISKIPEFKYCAVKVELIRGTN